MVDYFCHETSFVDDGAQVGEGTKIWHYSHIQSDAKVGKNCIFGQNTNVGSGVVIGDKCKIQNNVSIYEGVTLEDEVFCGPSCVFTNDFTPRAHSDQGWELTKTLIKKGASIGANATIVCGNTVGSYATIGSGAVVTHDVPSHALMVGVPARQIGWVCTCGKKLNPDFTCECGRHFEKTKDGIKEI